MPLLNWEENYTVGVKELDDQHKKMFALINGLYDSMKESKDKETREKLLQELVDYGKYHLETEEKLFDEFDYPEKEDHKKNHDSYRNRIQEFISKKDDTLLSFDIMDYLEDWWLGHIVSIDKRYKDFFNRKGLK